MSAACRAHIKRLHLIVLWVFPVSMFLNDEMTSLRGAIAKLGAAQIRALIAAFGFSAVEAEGLARKVIVVRP